MSVSEINLLASQSYNKIQNRPIIDHQGVGIGDPIERAQTFHNMVNKNFNSFAMMRPEQILARIQNANMVSQSASNVRSDIVSSSLDRVGATLSQQENIAKQVLTGEASVTDLLVASTNAKNTIDTAVHIRTKITDTLNQIMNLSV